MGYGYALRGLAMRWRLEAVKSEVAWMRNTSSEWGLKPIVSRR